MAPGGIRCPSRGVPNGAIRWPFAGYPGHARLMLQVMLMMMRRISLPHPFDDDGRT